jgi:hypothetical protein
MKLQFTTFLAVCAFLVLVAIGFNPATQAESNKTINAKTTNLTTTKTLTEAQKAIPDEVAWELFFRTIDENNARQLLIDAEIDEDRFDEMMNFAKYSSLNWEIFDKKARDIKQQNTKFGNVDLLANSKVKKDLADLDLAKSKYTSERLSERLPNRYPENGKSDWDKLEEYVRTEVKSHILIISPKELKAKATEKEKAKFVKTSFKKDAQTQNGNAYLYVAGWNDGVNVYGAGTVTEQYSSGTSYLVTVMVTSPSGRVNTTSGGWDYASLSNSTGLSLGYEPGTYNIQANFEADLGGYYDEWGTYTSYGSYFVGSLSTTTFLLPRIGIQAMRIFPTITGNTVNTFTANIEADISFDVGFPDTDFRLNLNPFSNPNGVIYTFGIPIGGNVIPNTNNRSVIMHSGQATFKTVQWSVNFSNRSPNGNSIIENVNIDPSQFLPPNTVTVNPNSQSVTFNYQKPTPTPTPIVTPTPTPVFPTPFPTPTPSSCFYAGIGCGGLANYQQHPNTNGCGFQWFNHFGCCCQGSPIVIDIDGNGFAMTNGENGVYFDLNGDGFTDRTSWTTTNSDDAWLVLDRNNNQKIDNGKELFGNYCDQPAPPAGTLKNGFSGLAEFDKAENGGNADGKITRKDTVFKKLRLWQDKNHNGISEPEELSKLRALDVVAIFLNYQESNRTDEFGNRFKFRAKVRDAQGARVGRWAWDIFVVQPRN